MFLNLQPDSFAMRNALEMGSIGMVPKGELAWELQASLDEVLHQFSPAIHNLLILLNLVFQSCNKSPAASLINAEIGG